MTPSARAATGIFARAVLPYGHPPGALLRHAGPGLRWARPFLATIALAACATAPRDALDAASDAWTVGVVAAAQRPDVDTDALDRADACWRLAYAALGRALGVEVIEPLAGDAERCVGGVQDSHILPAESAPAHGGRQPEPGP